MNFATVEGRTLKHALRPLIETVERGSSIPVLACVRLTLGADGLRLEATDLDISVSTQVDVIDGAGTWGLCLPAHALVGIARVAGVMPLRIEPGEKATIRLGDGEAVYTLDPLPTGDFPELAFKRGELIEHFGNGRLVTLLDKVRAFISTEETRYYLNGVAWQRGAFGSRMAATDGHRLAVCTYDREPGEAASRIIPRKAVHLLVKHFAGRDVAVFAAESPLGLVFEADGLRLATKLIDGTYPDIDKVIPQDGPFAISLVRAEVIAGIERLVALGVREGNLVKVHPCEGRIALERRGNSGGSALVTLSSSWPEPAATGGLAPFGLNAFYLGDMMHACEGDITLGMSGPGDPLLVKDADPAMTRVLMPMRV